MTRILAASLALLVAATAAEAGVKKRPPNVIHFIADDVGYDDLGCFGAKKLSTPNLDKLAKGGRKLTSFYAPHAYCTPSRAAFITGCYAQRVGLPIVLFPDTRYGLNTSEETIAEILQRLGYRTAMIGKWHLGCHLPFLPPRHGFDLFLGIPYPNDHVPERLTMGKPEERKARGFPPMPLYRGEKIVEQPAQLASLPERFAAEAVRFIEENKDHPFFLHYANIETHIPWLVTRPFMGKSKGGVYGDAVYCMDWQMGQIHDALVRLGLEKDTLIVFNSDNGRLRNPSPELEGIFGHAAAVDLEIDSVLRGGKGQARYDGGVRVSCIASWPGKIAAGSDCDAMCAGFDLYTTFAKVAGGDIPKDRIVDGKDIRPLLFDDKAKSPHEALFFYENFNLVAAREGKWKLVLPGAGKKGKKDVPGKVELYDLEVDLAQTKNIAGDHPMIVERLQARLEMMRDDLGDDSMKRPGKNRRPPAKMSE